MPTTTAMFDIDDLSFFRTLGLGFRHVDIQQGLREYKEGSNRGDAVSLANYGLSKQFPFHPFQFGDSHCETFQKHLEQFIYDSFKHHHESFFHYQDAAFSVMNRGDDARSPYDYEIYPLGKCQTQKFVPEQIHLFFTTAEYQNENKNQATVNVMMDLKNRLRAFKVQKTGELISRLEIEHPVMSDDQRKLLHAMLVILRDNYQKNIAIDHGIFADMYSLITNDKQDPRHASYLFGKIQEKICDIDAARVKGESTIRIIYHKVELEQKSIPELLNLFFEFIGEQNRSRVNECLQRLPNETLSNIGMWPLREAATYPDVEISKTIVEQNTAYYKSLMANENYTSPLAQAVFQCHLGQIQYFVSIQTIFPHSLVLDDGKNALYMPAFRGEKAHYEMVKFLLANGASIGNDILIVTKNAFASAAKSNGSMASDIIMLMLPYTNYHSKYLGLVSATNELYYLYRCVAEKPDPSYEKCILHFQALRRLILNSLTLEEWGQISQLHSGRKDDMNFGESILQDELLKNELKIAKQNTQTRLAENLAKYFGNSRKLDFIQNAGISGTPFWNELSNSSSIQTALVSNTEALETKGIGKTLS